MLASKTVDLMLESGSLPQETANAAARVALAYGDFLSNVISDNAHAAANGLKVVDAFSSPDGREGDCSARVKTFPTDLTQGQVDRAVSRVLTLSRLAGRVSRLASRDEDMPKLERSVRASLAQLGTLDADLWQVWTTSAKAHLSGEDAAILDADGFAWTASRKGYATTIRYDETAQNYSRNGKSYTQGMDAMAYVSERDMLDD